MECLEQEGDIIGAQRALEEALQWKCKPIARIHEAMDRLEKRKLLVRAHEHDGIVVLEEPISVNCDQKTLPSSESEEFDFKCNYEEPLLQSKPRRDTHTIIDEAARQIKQFPSNTTKSLQSTPKKAMSVDRGTKMVLTPLRASKRVRSGTIDGI